MKAEQNGFHYHNITRNKFIKLIKVIKSDSKRLSGCKNVLQNISKDQEWMKNKIRFVFE